MPPTHLATYRRRVTASLERIWENVLDWEHLPHLHRDTFAHVRLLDQNPNGWRAEASLREGSRGGDPFVIDIELERALLRYRARTVDGPGTGAEILTRLTPESPHVTHIEVEFWRPDIPPSYAEIAGRAYVELYTRLWDEDEAMMVRRQALIDGTLPRASRAIEIDGARVSLSTVCPHLGGPLEDAPVEEGCITCPWHGYRFDVRTGRSADGRSYRLASRASASSCAAAAERAASSESGGESP
jgi:nitrite reductase/ring-hydroxylating ferredoxin subunit